MSLDEFAVAAGRVVELGVSVLIAGAILACAALPAILISARVTGALRDLPARSGPTRILEKPLTTAALVENIHGALASPV